MTPIFDAEAAARVLLEVRGGGARPVGLPATPPDPDSAYAVQAAVLRQSTGPASWKMALLAGRDRHAAAMPASEVVASGAILGPLPAAAIEVETAFVLGADLPTRSTPEAVLAAVAEVRLAFEIVSSRYRDRTVVHPLEAMADCFNSAGIVLGDAIPDWRDRLNGPLDLTLSLDGQPVVATEQGATLPQTADFLAWLSTRAADMGLPLVAGTVIISGARIGPILLGGAREATATAGSVTVGASFSDAAKLESLLPKLMAPLPSSFQA
ncbi:fumarylacetoacetate hydrolase family protein [Paracoccus marcusii]|uniref:fumarylacetoacetate hydrolase family protein n=1 Tax=Paracoccus marcusii TaxID=59779 RepID=UPI0035A61118